MKSVLELYLLLQGAIGAVLTAGARVAGGPVPAAVERLDAVLMRVRDVVVSYDEGQASDVMIEVANLAAALRGPVDAVRPPDRAQLPAGFVLVNTVDGWELQADDAGPCGIPIIPDRATMRALGRALIAAADQ